MNRESPKFYVFYCSNAVDSGFATLRRDKPDQVQGLPDDLTESSFKLISLPCSGKIDIPYLVKAFETGAEGVVILTCKKGECQHLEGNLRAQKRAEAVESLLEEIGMSKGRMAVIMLKDGGVEQAIRETREFFESVRKLPYHGLEARENTAKMAVPQTQNDTYSV